LTAAAQWPWERLAESNAPSHDALVELLAPKPGERFLDVGTGSGGVALRAARAGASVVGADVAKAPLAHARRAAADESLDAEFVVADAQALPFGDASFDVVASAFGVNFARDHAAAARELARVCRRGGRLGLTLMPPGTRAGAFWDVIRDYGPDGDHPAAWGTEQRARELLGDEFELDVRLHESPPEPERSPDEVWQFMRTQFGPIKAIVESLPADEAEALRARVLDLRGRFAGRPLSHLVVLGTRR
jgi:SAM-dependent methyltransferase